jgi:sulfoxide reductase catalytic subunit YedY
MSLRDALRIPSSEITDESVYRERRALLRAFAMAPALALSGCA